MATYSFHGSCSELIQQQPESTLQTLYLMTPNYHHKHHSQSHHLHPTSMLNSGFQNGLFINMGSKYLKAAQQLLDEVVNVATEAPHDGGGEEMRSCKEKLERLGGVETNELNTAQRQELQMKKAKLLNMFDEVEQRYRQYNNHMQIVVSSFEQAVGIGSAKSYTGLALQTISKQFRRLKDEIGTQIKAAANGLGEDDDDHEPAGSEGGSRLKYVDHQLRQQRALQQLGMMPPPPPHNAWRHQRGLPEKAVSVLRAWLFEHFLHPYPKDSDKHMLAKQTGLTRSQVSNWFINARVRLWKPMVEEMYLEEIKQHDLENINGKNKTLNCTINVGEPNMELGGSSKSISSKIDHHQTTQAIHANINPSFPNHLPIQNLAPKDQTIPNKPKPSENNILRNSSPSSIENPNEKRYSFITGNNNDFGTRFDHEHLIVDHASGGFNGIGGVSLTLGLPRCHESLSRHNLLSDEGIMGVVQTSHYGGMGTTSASPPHSSNGYEAMDIDNSKRFVAPLLPNFVI
ncbi:BEL1-like homeodomain protein 1 [Impatiens glandulifera]|uniref:BEL1-like homeodomain protein 1 n=1 Tax=Impatiens glandulifera TaxID=253017 RepID=UPI001FB0752B|nr:BEL1-like homeodomain protein 1 [Impatiens glandulifera]